MVLQKELVVQHLDLLSEAGDCHTRPSMNIHGIKASPPQSHTSSDKVTPTPTSPHLLIETLSMGKIFKHMSL